MFGRKILLIVSAISIFLSLGLCYSETCSACVSEAVAIVPDLPDSANVQELPLSVPTFAPTATFIGVRSVVVSQLSGLSDLAVNSTLEYNIILIDLILLLCWLAHVYYIYIMKSEKALARAGTKSEKTSLQSLEN